MDLKSDTMVVNTWNSGACLLLLALLSACSPSLRPARFRLPEPLREVSGLARSGPDSLWWLNDSGDQARLFLTDGRGQLLREVAVPGARNRDWEDLAIDGQGYLYIGDFGNNAQLRRDLCIYRFHPQRQELDSIRFRYPDQQEFPPSPERSNFDMEGFFWFGDSLHLFSKNQLPKGNYFTKHYVLPARAGEYTAELRDSLYLRKRVVTGAAIRRDGLQIALLAYWYKRLLGFIPLTATHIFFLDSYPDDAFLRGQLSRRRVPKCLAPTQYESIDYEGPDTVIVASERVVIFPQKARRLKLGQSRKVKP